MGILLIDKIVINDHIHLELGVDTCYYYFNYTADKGFQYSECNELILNFKKGLQYKGTNHYKYKDIAINKIAQLFSNISQSSIDKSTFVPIPPSKSKNHDLYDDRVLEALKRGLADKGADIRELVYQTTDTIETHLSGATRSVLGLQEILEIDETITSDLRDYIVLVDDVITTGCHFKAIKNLLLQRFPNKKIIGLFVARRELINDLQF